MEFHAILYDTSMHASHSCIPVQDWDWYGIDWNGPVPTDRDDTVTVPEFAAELATPIVTETLQQQLERVAGDNILRYLFARDVLQSLLA